MSPIQKAARSRLAFSRIRRRQDGVGAGLIHNIADMAAARSWPALGSEREKATTCIMNRCSSQYGTSVWPDE